MTFTRHLCRGAATLFTGVVVLAAVVAGIGAWAGYRPQPVLSGSMEPTLPVGSLAVARPVPATSVREGDVITFGRPGTPGETITHRVVNIDRRDGKVLYTTKGDANESVDPWKVRLPGNVGEHVATVPYAGYVAVAAAQREVRAATAVLLTLLLMMAAVRRINRPQERAGAATPPGPVFTPSGPALHGGWAPKDAA